MSPDGTTLTSAGWDGTVFLWRLTPTTAPLAFNPSTIAAQTFEVGTPVNITLPIATGGTLPYTYTLSPVPAGLAFNTATHVLFGTPTTAMNPTPVTYTVTDASGETASLSALRTRGGYPEHLCCEWHKSTDVGVRANACSYLSKS